MAAGEGASPLAAVLVAKRMSKQALDQSVASGKDEVAVSDPLMHGQVEQLTLAGKHAALFPELRDLRVSLKALRANLEEVRVLGQDGQVTDFYDKLMREPALPRAAKTRVLRALAEVRESFWRLDNAVAPGAPNKGYQIVNWNHTRAELDQVLEAAKMAKLGAADLENALLASMFSDAVKWPQNFIVHNIDGAAAAVYVLARGAFALEKPRSLARLAAISTIIKEHQIGPPQFMAFFIKGQLTRKLKEQGRDESATVANIARKVAHPFEAAHLTPAGNEISFAPEEKALLALLGVESWCVPHASSAWYGASRAVVDGDSLINYASPDGWAKIAALRGPDTQPFFEDPTVIDSLQSAKHSYDDALAVVSSAARPLAEAGLARTKGAVKRMRDGMRLWFATQGPWLPANPDGSIAFWNAPLKYPSQGQLAQREQDQFVFAKRIRDKVIELLKAEQGRY